MKQFFTLLAAVLFTATTVAQVGINTETPDPSAALDIVSTTGGLLVPRMTAAKRGGIKATQGLIIFCTDCASNEGELQVRLTSSWISLHDGGDVNDPPVVGDFYGGGVVFYILQENDIGYDAGKTHGLIAAVEDQSPGIAWIIGGNTQTTSNGGTSALIGKGQANTRAMMRQDGYEGGAAQVCDDYSIAADRIMYTDWFLPSKDELNKMYLKMTNINNIALLNGGSNFADPYLYWSSTESGSDFAWDQDFIFDEQNQPGKYRTFSVRAVRAF